MKKLLICALAASVSFACSTPGRYSSGVSSVRGKKIVRTAEQYTGIPYRAGGSSPSTGFDCSGFVQYVYKLNRISLPRTAEAQYRGGRKISSKYLAPGDLVFFQTSWKRISHVGIYAGRGKFIHAPSSGKKTCITAMNSTYWKRRYRGAATYLRR